MSPASTGPRLAKKRGDRPARSEPPPAVLEGTSILVVDEDSSAAKLFSIILEHAGAFVRVASSAEAALVVLQTYHPDCIVLDPVLPRMSGLTLARAIRAESWASGALIVAASSFNGAEAERTAMRFGCDAYVKKPVDIEGFPSMLAGWLDRSRG